MTIPDEITRLVYLESLHLSGAGISGEFPQNMVTPTSWFQRLESFVINNTNLTGPIPMWRASGYLSPVADFSNNKFTELPVWQKPVTTVFSKLNLCGNQISASIDEMLSCIWAEGTYELDLSNNYITGEIPASISSYTNLEYLDLSHNQLSGELPNEMRPLGGLSGKLRFLDLSYNNLSGNPDNPLFNGTVFDTLRIKNNRFSGTIANYISPYQEKWDWYNDILPQQDGYVLTVGEWQP